MTTIETILKRLDKLGLSTDTVATDSLESATTALACFPMYMVANVDQWTADSQFRMPFIGLPGMEAIREAFAIGQQEAELSIEREHRRVLNQHLKSERHSDLIIYEFALETLRLYLQMVNNQVANQLRTAIARMIVAVAGASGEGLLGGGAKFSEGERSCIEQIAETLNLRSSAEARQALDQVEAGDADKLMVVYTTNDANDAELLRVALRAEGMKCEIDGESQAGFSGLNAMEINVLVRGEDFDQAKSYVQKHHPGS